MFRRFFALPSLCFLVFVLAIAEPARAVKTSHAVIEGFASLAKGKGQAFAISADGTLSAGPSVTATIDLGTDQAWSIYRRPDHALFIGTASDGKLVEVQESGAVKVVNQVKEPAIYAVTGSPDGRNIFFASSHDGRIYRMNPDGEPEVWFEPHEKYIWALLVGPDGSLYAATGTKGKLYRITGKGQGQVWFSSSETHLRSLALDAAGNLLAGSADSGLLYRISGQEQGVVIADSGHQEINQICAASTGEIFFVANGVTKPVPEEKPPLSNMMDAAHALPSKPDNSVIGTPAGMDEAVKPGSDLFELDRSLNPRVLWHGESSANSLLWDGTHVWLSSGSKGYTYSISPSGDTTVTQIGSQSITASLFIDDGTFAFVTSNPARYLNVSPKPGSANSTYDSDIIDSKGYSRWGQLSVTGANLSGVEVLVRSGFTPFPDKTWFSWETVETTPHPLLGLTGKFIAPGARYAQVELKYPATALIDKVEVSYLTTNHQPNIKGLFILPPSVRLMPVILPDMPAQPRTDEQVGDGEGLEQLIHPADKPSYRWVPEFAKGYRSFSWAAADPDGDDLTYALSYRAAGGDWKDLAHGLTDTVYSVDTSGWPDGRYEIKVTASDANANPEGQGLQDELVNHNLIVNNTPPAIHSGSPADGKIEFDVTDDLSLIHAVSISHDGRDFNSIVPTDGIGDSTSEHFSVPLKPGESLYIRAEDSSGNVSSKVISG